MSNDSDGLAPTGLEAYVQLMLLGDTDTHLCDVDRRALQGLLESARAERARLVAALEKQGVLLRRAVGVISDHSRLEREARAVLDAFVDMPPEAAGLSATPPVPPLCGALGACEGGRFLRFACTCDRGHAGPHIATSSLGHELYRWPR